jgi:hypothetical protein
MNNAYPCSPRVSCRDIFCPLPAASRNRQGAKEKRDQVFTNLVPQSFLEYEKFTYIVVSCSQESAFLDFALQK